MIGIILAGGKATRLGPLAAQLNKSLVTVGQKPMLVRQVQQLLKAGADEVRVVVSPGAQDQVEGVISRAGLPQTSTVVQRRALGPAEAVSAALRPPLGRDQSVLLLTADTVLSDEDVEQLTARPNRCAVMAAPTERTWCAWTGVNWRDQIAGPQKHIFVAVGAYFFKSSHSLYFAVSTQQPGYAGEYQLSDLMNRYRQITKATVNPWPVKSWMDVGDVPALARANREHFIHRSFNGMQMHKPGVVTKYGRSTELDPEIRFMRDVPAEAAHLFPRLFESRISAAEAEPSFYEMEFVDSPSLAELWNYWPSQPDMWEHIAREVHQQLSERLWVSRGGEWTYDEEHMKQRSRRMLHDKLRSRYETANVPEAHTVANLEVNGITIDSGAALVRRVAEESVKLTDSISDWAGLVHGDPTFLNIMWSLKTGSFKLLDPRGDWGGLGPFGDTRYDIAKFLTSPVMAPLQHGLFSLHEGEPGEYHFALWPDRYEEAKALMKPFEEIPGVELLMANCLLSSAPLHEGAEREAIYIAGCWQAYWALENQQLRPVPPVT